ncbi:GDP-mannose 4,6-dehydratase [Ruminococcus sp.]|uniref:GDP-mannose 4,6-dehydratase n=1 Tax=Ruminococcus sp. TaxID=41978 RepID=UPI0025F6A2A8|nr:GDP-mannose 4,6-dehydratase [Ruminococcus sp.]
MKALITGSAGFYGKHLCAELEENGYEVIRCDLKAEDNIISMDIMNSDMVLDIISQHRPDVLVNMAGQANVGLSWKKPQLTVQLNTIGLINILEVVKNVNPKMRVIAIGSSDEYGNLKERGANVVEEMPVSPMTPYAISKQAQEQFALLYNKYFGMNVCMVRQFNLGGAGQAKGFMISDFASGIVEIERGQSEYLSVGNLESARDFTHVKDACCAIRLIAEKGHTGEVYNICSGYTHTAQEVLDKLISMAKVQIEVRQDPARMRPSDTPVVRGNHDKLTSHTGWNPKMNLDEIIKDALDFWRAY